MKKLVLMFGATLIMAQPAFAEQLSLPYEAEEGAMNSVELQSLNHNRDRNRGEEFVGGVINIIGAIAADRLNDSDNDWRYRDRQFTCFARNGRGEVFRAIGHRPRAVQARAIDKCYRESRRCRPLGCRLNRH